MNIQEENEQLKSQILELKLQLQKLQENQQQQQSTVGNTTKSKRRSSNSKSSLRQIAQESGRLKQQQGGGKKKTNGNNKHHEYQTINNDDDDEDDDDVTEISNGGTSSSSHKQSLLVEEITPVGLHHRHVSPKLQRYLGVNSGDDGHDEEHGVIKKEAIHLTVPSLGLPRPKSKVSDTDSNSGCFIDEYDDEGDDDNYELTKCNSSEGLLAAASNERTTMTTLTTKATKTRTTNNDNHPDNDDHDEQDEDHTIINDRSTFIKILNDRASWLVVLLVLQSCSSFILKYNEKLLQRHTIIVQFLTMLVGAGGNAGNQASVRVIRGLALNKINTSALARQFLLTEIKFAICLSAILGVAGCIRAILFLVPMRETIAITSSLIMIVLFSIFIGSLLPLGMYYIKIDPAHSSTTIQVLMDILGVTITVVVSSLILH